VQAVDSPTSFPRLEDELLLYWQADDTFTKSITQRAGSPTYVFYDGPPFATGLPHYGHILTSYIKDTVPRYFTMRGYQVPRRWGWDCHGLPVEFEVEKELGLKSRKDILDLGVEQFNEACRRLVMRYAAEWRAFVQRMGRWVDFDGAYRTMDAPYMESVIWAFKQLYEKGLAYEGNKVVPYCTRCQTGLSNFEARLDDAFRPRRDPSLFVKFRRADAGSEYFVAWTTTPWTLPSNAALAVAPDLEYSLLEFEGDLLWIATAAIPQALPAAPAVRVVNRALGLDLLGSRYFPVLPLSHWAGESFPVLAADFVTAIDGTGIVHIAPAFGEDDAALAAANGVKGANPVRDDGTYDETAGEYLAGQHVFQVTATIVRALKKDGLLLQQNTIEHNYPHCWRCDNPLIYRAVKSWFIRVSELKEQLIELNRKINWVPEHIKEGRMGDWLANARDWAVSRSRFWGAPIPVWQCAACSELQVIGGCKELQERSQRPVVDLHRPKVDEHLIPCPRCSAQMRRIPDVFDCWFESGSMPFASQHYPFEDKPAFEEQFPGDFIVEYIAQTRGWFYTLMVLSTACFDKEPFSNALCHGVILARDGRKMSKRLKNYPDPMQLMRAHGSDALRVALLSSSVCKGEDIRFTEVDGVNQDGR
jgi:isoleucyl-tRNA synthetase